MLIGSGFWLGGILGHMHISPYPPPTYQAGSVRSAPSGESRSQLSHLRRLAVRLRHALQKLEQPFRSTRIVGTSRAASITSSSALGLEGATAASLLSTEEVNATPTSFSPFGPDWSGVSTALATLDGVYDESQGDTYLTFEVLQGGTHGQQNLRIKVTDSGGGTVDQIDIDSNDPIDTPYQLSNGLILTLGEGDLLGRDTFSVAASSTVGSVVDPDKPFNGLRNERPNFEYGFGVSTGSFTLNGETIAVLADDTIGTVLVRINQSAAGVLASFDAASETIRLIYQTPGAAGTIELGPDTSGFLASTKLANSVTTPGQDADADRPLQTVPRFAGVLSGAIAINGVAIAIDPTTDTLKNMLARINASSAEVLAQLDPTGQRVTITAAEFGQVLVLDDGGTGFLSALDIAAGTYQPTEGAGRYGGGLSTRDANDVADVVELISEILNEIFAPPQYRDHLGTTHVQIRSSLRKAVADAFGSEGQRLHTKFGVNFDWQAPVGRVFKFAGANRNLLVSALKRNPSTVNDLFHGSTSSSHDGLVDKLLTALATVVPHLDTRLGATGVHVDTRA